MMLGLLAWPSVADKQKSSEMPAMAFLEFLAEMEEVDGKLLSASDLLELNPDANQKIKAGKEQEPLSKEALDILTLLDAETPEAKVPKGAKQPVKEEDKQ